jgi:hypothetical protein
MFYHFYEQSYRPTNFATFRLQRSNQNSPTVLLFIVTWEHVSAVIEDSYTGLMVEVTESDTMG